MTVMVLKQAEQTLHDQAYRHLGLYAYRVKLLQEYVTWDMGVLEKLESLEQLRVLGKWSPYCHCCSRSKFTTGRGYSS